MGDPLFMLRNYYLIGAYNAAINEASDLEGLPGPVQVEKDAYVYRSYIELGSHDVSERLRACRPTRAHALAPNGHRAASARDAGADDASCSRPPTATSPHPKQQLVINEIADTAPIGLRAVKLLAQVRRGSVPAESALATLAEWREGDLAGAARDPHVLLVAGALHAAEGNHVEALKACNAGPQTLEM